MADTIICPKCKYEIEVTEVLSSQLREKIRKEYDADLRKKEQEFQGKEEDLRKREQAVERSKQAIDAEVQTRLTKERARVDQESLTKAKEAVAFEIRDKDNRTCRKLTAAREESPSMSPPQNPRTTTGQDDEDDGDAQ